MNGFCGERRSAAPAGAVAMCDGDPAVITAGLFRAVPLGLNGRDDGKGFATQAGHS